VTQAAPLIVTAELPEALQSRADQLRRLHYPPERNVLAAHLTLFHALPPSVEDELRDALAAEARAKPIPARLEGVMSLGRGTALRITSPAMIELRELQDAQVPRLHVTIQNKVSPHEAKVLMKRLIPEIEALDFAFTGLALHRYLGGPWETLKRWSFRG
jgi:hypothetical protein